MTDDELLELAKIVFWKSLDDKYDYEERIEQIEEILSEKNVNFLYRNLDEYESICKYNVNDAFRAGWDMARLDYNKITEKI